MAFIAATVFFGGALAIVWTFWPALFPWIVGVCIASIVFSKADIK